MKKSARLLIFLSIFLLLLTGCHLNKSEIKEDSGELNDMVTFEGIQEPHFIEEIKNYEIFSYYVDSTEQYAALIGVDMSNEETLTIPSQIANYSVVCIGEEAFSNSQFSEIIIPDTVKWIKDSAFVGNENLKNVVFGSNVISIGNSAFVRCSSLEEVVLPESLMSIGEDVFEDYVALKKAYLPDTLQSFGKYIFRYCGQLAEVISATAFNKDT